MKQEWNKKTLQQFPLRKQVGKHIQIDTQALIDILIDKTFDYNYINIFNKSFQPIKNKLDLFAPKLKRKNKKDDGKKPELKHSLGKINFILEKDFK